MTFGAIGGTILGGVAAAGTSALIGSAFGSDGAQSAGSAAADPFASQRGQYQESLQRLMTGAFSPSDPSYGWRFGQGQQAIERSLGAHGLLNSGNRLTALTDYGQGQASTEYANQFSRLSQLSGANVGSPAAAGQIIQGNQSAANGAFTAVGNQVGKAVTGWFNTPAVSSDSASAYNSIGDIAFGGGGGGGMSSGLGFGDGMDFSGAW
jgi:hypothetical protein